MDYGGGDLLMRINETDFSKPMQWTGLYDKNGVKILEGDIIDCGVRLYRGSVVYSNGRYYAKDKCGLRYIGGYKNKLEEEVVGNIYEHPEILSDKK